MKSIIREVRDIVGIGTTGAIIDVYDVWASLIGHGRSIFYE